MTVYLIALTEESEDAWQKIKDEWPEHCHFVTGTLALISISNGISASSTISDRMGISPEPERPSGIVVRIKESDDIAGALPTSAVDWLKAANL